MMKPRFSRNDIETASVNNQEFEIGTSVIRADDNKVFFISTIEGTSVTVKDADGVTKGILSHFHSCLAPIRLEKGFSLTAGANFSALFFSIAVGNRT